LAREGRNEFWFPWGRLGNQSERRLRQGASGVISPDSCLADNADTSCVWENWAPFGRLEAGNVATAGRRGVNRVVTRGRRCRQRLFGVVVDGLASRFTFARERKC
jgi:hypothetical protein